MRISRLKWIAEELFLRSSWVMFFIFICLMIYESNLQHYHRDLEGLQSKVNTLERGKKEALQLNESLKLKVSNHDDPAWVSLVLMEELGLVPEGQRKIIFKESISQ